MVWHDHPFLQPILYAVKVQQSLGHDVCNLRAVKIARARTTVEVTLHVPAQIAVSRFPACGVTRLQFSQCLGTLPLKIEKHVSRQRIGQPECYKVARPLAFDVRQITARVNSAAQAIGCFRPNASSAKFVSNALETGVGFAVGHDGRIGFPIPPARLLFVAQTGSLPYRRMAVGRRDATVSRLRIFNPRHGRLPACATKTPTGPLPVAQIVNLPYRRLAVGGRDVRVSRLRIFNPRHGRLPAGAAKTPTGPLPVTQIVNLPYRRLSVGGRMAMLSRRRITNPRHGRLPACATKTPPGRLPVAQIVNLPYRRLSVGDRRRGPRRFNPANIETEPHETLSP